MNKKLYKTEGYINLYITYAIYSRKIAHKFKNAFLNNFFTMILQKKDIIWIF